MVKARKKTYRYYNRLAYKRGFRNAIKNYAYKRIVFIDTLRTTSSATAFVTLNATQVSISTWMANQTEYQNAAKQFLSWKLCALSIEVTPGLILDNFGSSGNEFIIFNAVTDSGSARDYLSSKNCLVLNRNDKNRKYIRMKGGQSGWMDTGNTDDIAGAIRVGTSGQTTGGQMDYTVRIVFYCTFKNPD